MKTAGHITTLRGLRKYVIVRRNRKLVDKNNKKPFEYPGKLYPAPRCTYSVDN